MRKSMPNQLALIAIFSVALIFIAYSGQIISPHVKSLLPSPIKDAIATEQGKTAAVLNNSAENRKWHLSQEGRTLFSELKALNDTNINNELYRPAIRLSCKDNSFTASYQTKEILGTESATLSITLDDSLPLVQNWALNPSYQSAITDTPAVFISHLKMARKLSIGYKPFGEDSEKTATFDLHGSAISINVFKRKCDQLRSS